MTTDIAFSLRSMIHTVDVRAREERANLIRSGVTTPSQALRLREIERELDLIANAALATHDLPEMVIGNTNPAITIWRAISRGAKLSWDRWIPVAVAFDQIFRKNMLTPSGV